MPTIEKFSKMPEIVLQKAAHKALSDPALVRNTASGKRLQILSPGRHNVHEGPDYLETAILLDGEIIIGDAEFHKKSSDWESHNHSSDENYKNVVLHIILEKDIDVSQPFETLVLTEFDMEAGLKQVHIEENRKADIESVEDLQDYALLRLLRKTAEAQKLLNEYGPEKALNNITYGFITKYNGRRKRPVYSVERLELLLKSLGDSGIPPFLDGLSAARRQFIPDMMQNLIRQKIADEGAHLRREIILNCVLPMALCLAGEEARISLFLWFWSTPALNSYGILKRRFSKLPQNFLWQQQGMLEYIREHGRKPAVVSETVRQYGFAEILSFYRVGRSPLQDD